jgi:hypothetical protein
LTIIKSSLKAYHKAYGNEPEIPRLCVLNTLQALQKASVIYVYRMLLSLLLRLITL